MDFQTKIYLIEGGRPLEMVKQYITEVQRVAVNNRALALEIGGVKETYVMKDTGVLAGVIFAAEIHPEFTKPRHANVSYPKKGTPWAKRFNAQQGHKSVSDWISKEFLIPCSISYRNATGTTCGWHVIGIPFRECGFLWCSVDGPYAMWIPDVQGSIHPDRGTPEEPAASFVFAEPGTKPITNDEWKLIALQEKIAHARVKS